MSLEKRISAALGEIPADLVIKNANVISIPSGRIYKNDIAISDGVILGVGKYKAKKVIDVKGMYVSYGFYDAHMHMESTMISPEEFAKTVVPMGTTTVIVDPHEIANVVGLRGIQYILNATEGLPLDVYVMLPSCVPATHMETSGASLSAKDLEPLFDHPRVIGLGEMMNFPGVINRKREILQKIKMAISKGKIVDGHAPGLTKKILNAYLMANIRSDHESTTAKEAQAKLAAGLHIMVREGTCERNLKDLLPVVNKTNAHRCMFCSDDRAPRELLEQGHMNYIVKKAIRYRMDPVLAIQMATANPADYFRLSEKQGAIAVGHRADLVVIDNFKKFNIKMVFKRGKLVAKDGKMIIPVKSKKHPRVPHSMNVKKIHQHAFSVPAFGKKIRVIELVKDQIITNELIVKPKIEDGYIKSDIKRDIIKIAVIERHKATGNICVGFVKGFGLQRGAIASTIAHDSHNIIVVGVKKKDMMVAVHALISANGGIVVVDNQKVVELLPLPIAGLMSPCPIKNIAKEKEKLIIAAEKLGSKIHDPFQSMSFLSLPVIPKLKITDMGLVDVDKFGFVDLILEPIF